ncbi:hypothetical protein ACOME3_009611 [Neoechinorhynchus agilis]
MAATSEFNSEFEYYPDEETYSPPSRVVNVSLVKSLSEYEDMYQRSTDDPSSFWAQFVDNFYWHKKPDSSKLLEYRFCDKDPLISWFPGGYTNLCYNCLDFNISKGIASEVAFDWIGNDPSQTMTYTYSDLLKEVTALSLALVSLGIKEGDVVAVYTGMVPETIVAMLATARIGAVHMVVFGGYSSDALAARMIDSKARILVTIDGCYRATKLIRMENIAKKAVSLCRAVQDEKKYMFEKIIIKRHLNRFEKGESDERQLPDDIIDYDQLVSPFRGLDVSEPAWMESNSTLFILHTSGSTGKPKGIVHSLAGYMVYAAVTFNYTFNMSEGDVFFCTGDLGWITGHTYNCYGPLLTGRRFVMLEGIILHPDAGFCWRMCEKYRVTHLYTAPTAIRALQKHGSEVVKKSDLSRLKVIGTVGEPISKTSWSWLYEIVGKSKCAIVDTYFLTEAGGHLITTLPGVHKMKPCSAGKPFFGVAPAIVDEDGKELTDPNSSVEGYLVFKQPWPGMMRGIYGAFASEYGEKYFGRFGGKYFFTGDGAIRDKDGYLWVTGRVDDMMNCSGHLLSSAEIENVISTHPDVYECAVVAVPHVIKGQCPYAFVVRNDNATKDNKYPVTDIIGRVRGTIGPFAAPDKILFVSSLPKTRSGKLMRRILRHLCLHKVDFGDVSALTEPSMLECLVREVDVQLGAGKIADLFYKKQKTQQLINE